MSIIADWLSGPGGGTLLLLISLFKIGVDSYKMDTVERIRLTNIGKMLIFISQAVVFTVIMGTFILILILIISNGELPKEDGDYLKVFTYSFIVPFILIFISLIIVHSLFNTFSVKTSFYILLNHEKFTIVRKMDGKIYLLKGKNNKNLFYEAEKLLNKEIFEELECDPKNSGFMFWLNKHEKISAVASSFTLFLGVVLVDYFSIVGWGVFLFILGIVFLLLLTITYKNQEVIRRLRKNA